MNLEQHVISSASGEYSRNTWHLSGPKDKTHPLCIFLDGEHYVRDMDSLPVIEGLLKAGEIPPVSLLFVSHVSSVASQADYACRTADYTCNDRYSQFIAEDIPKRHLQCDRPRSGRFGNMTCFSTFACGETKSIAEDAIAVTPKHGWA